MTKDEFISQYKVSVDSTGLITSRELGIATGRSQGSAVRLIADAIEQGIMRASTQKKRHKSITGRWTFVDAYEFIEQDKPTKRRK